MHSKAHPVSANCTPALVSPDPSWLFLSEVGVGECAADEEHA